MAATYVSFFVDDSIITAFNDHVYDNQSFIVFYDTFVISKWGVVYFRDKERFLFGQSELSSPFSVNTCLRLVAYLSFSNFCLRIAASGIEIDMRPNLISPSFSIWFKAIDVLT